MYRYILLLFTMAIGLNLFARQQGKVTGTISSATDGSPVVGAVVRIKGAAAAGAITDSLGNFGLHLQQAAGIIEISAVGYKKTEYRVQQGSTVIRLKLQPDVTALQEVVVSTGIQNIPRERATGSFAHVDRNLFNRQVSTDIISRLEGIASSLMIDKREAISQELSVRGRSTIYSNSTPLIILNNFPYEGDIGSINPNDVESVTVLKDAAAASIWGVRAGNGVIVITTRQGMANQPLKIGFNTNYTLGEAPNLKKLPLLPATEYIALEQMLFENGYYDNDISDGTIPLSQAVTFLQQLKTGNAAEQEAAQQGLQQLAAYDIRNDMQKYLYGNSLLQQYALNINGGSPYIRYYFSAGVDDNTSNLDASSRRYTLRSDNTFQLGKKISMNAALMYTGQKSRDGKPSYGNYTAMPPYTRFADDAGNALAVNNRYSQAFIDGAEQQGLLDWNYRPLEELGFNRGINRSNQVLVNLSAEMVLAKGLKADARYQYSTAQDERAYLRRQESYEVRDIINSYTEVLSNGTVKRPVPLGAILDQRNGRTAGYAWRGQLNYGNRWKQHELNALAGAELREQRAQAKTFRTYGYDPDILTYVPVDYETVFSKYGTNAGTARIADGTGFSDITNRYVSFYANAAYHYAKRYTLSFSARKDGTNLFGVKSNQKIVPLWSAGMAWNISNEGFYRSALFPYLKLRTTFGYSGNLNSNVSALPTMLYYTTGNLNNRPYGLIRNPPNEALRWEKAGMLNIGVDFALRADVLKGSIEYYHKKNTDLLGYMPIDQTTGALSPLQQFTYMGNSASMKGQGVDVELHSRNINREVQWHTDLLLSHTSNKLTDYMAEVTDINSYLNGGLTVSPIIGKPAYAIFAYRWAGLDPETGDPQGVLGGEVTKDYAAIVSRTMPEELAYKGSAVPLWFGALRNTFTYRDVSLSFNISYRFAYYYRRNSVNYTALFKGTYTHTDYFYRWQQPGDEQHTNVPSLLYPNNPNRDSFYARSEAVISKADNIRLQDINLSYRIKDVYRKGNHIDLYAYVNNAGLLWKADKHPGDPDYGQLALPRTYALGLRMSF